MLNQGNSPPLINNPLPIQNIKTHNSSQISQQPPDTTLQVHALALQQAYWQVIQQQQETLEVQQQKKQKSIQQQQQ